MAKLYHIADYRKTKQQAHKGIVKYTVEKWNGKDCVVWLAPKPKVTSLDIDYELWDRAYGWRPPLEALEGYTVEVEKLNERLEEILE